MDLAPDRHERLVDALRLDGQDKRAARMSACGSMVRASTVQETGEIRWHPNLCGIPGCPKCEGAVARRVARRYKLKMNRTQKLLKKAGVPRSTRVKHVVLTTRTGEHADGHLPTPAKLRDDLKRVFASFGWLWSGGQARWTPHVEGQKDWTISALSYLPPQSTWKNWHPIPRQPTQRGRKLPLRWNYVKNKHAGALVAWELGANGMLHLHVLIIGVAWISKLPGGNWDGLSELWRKACERNGLEGKIVHISDVYPKGSKGRRKPSMGHHDGGTSASILEACKYVAKPHGHGPDADRLRELAILASDGFPRFRLYGSLRGVSTDCDGPGTIIYGPFAATREEALDQLMVLVNIIEGLAANRKLRESRGPPVLTHPLEWDNYEEAC